MFNIQIDWNKIVTNAVSALVTIVFVGAATVVWTKANGIEDAISEATKGLVVQTEKLDKTIIVIQKEMIEDRNSRREEIELLQEKILELQNQLLISEKEKPLKTGSISEDFNFKIPDLYPESILDSIDIDPITEHISSGASNFIPLPQAPKENFLMQQIQSPQQFME